MKLSPVIAAIGLVVLLTSCSSDPKVSENQQACRTYADGYNAVTDAIKSGSSIAVGIALGKRTDFIESAHKSASGQVEKDIADSLELSKAVDIVPDEGQAFYQQAPAVAKSCAADGAPIDLHATR